MAIVGVFLMVTFLIALAIAVLTDREHRRSTGQFFGALVIAWISVVSISGLLVYGVCASILGGGCINC